MSRTRLCLTRRRSATGPCQRVHALCRWFITSPSRSAAAAAWARLGAPGVTAVLCRDQTISRRSAQRVTDTRTRSLMCRFLSRGSGKMICRARECHGRRRAPLSLCLKCPYTRRTLKRHKHPGTLRLLSILSIPLSQTGRHLKSGKIWKF